VTAAPFQHRRGERLGQHHRGLEVDPDRAGQLLRAEVLQPAGGGQPGVGEKDVDLAGVGGELQRRARLGEVGGHHPVPLSRQLGSEGLQCLGLTSTQRQRRTSLGERLRNRPAEAASGAREECCTAGKFHPRAQASSRRADRNLG
jgi:hypothetical protein